MTKRKKTDVPSGEKQKLIKTAEAFKKYLTISPHQPSTSTSSSTSIQSGKKILTVRKPIRLWIPNKTYKFQTSSSSCYNTNTGGKYVTVDNKLRLIKCDSHVEYHGTFSKKSSQINGRRPTAKDEKLFNYDESDVESFGGGIWIEDDLSIRSDEESDTSSMKDFTEICNHQRTVGEDNLNYEYENASTVQVVGIRYIPANYKNLHTFNIDEDVRELIKYTTYTY